MSQRRISINRKRLTHPPAKSEEKLFHPRRSHYVEKRQHSPQWLRLYSSAKYQQDQDTLRWCSMHRDHDGQQNPHFCPPVHFQKLTDDNLQAMRGPSSLMLEKCGRLTRDGHTCHVSQNRVTRDCFQQPWVGEIKIDVVNPGVAFITATPHWVKKMWLHWKASEVNTLRHMYETIVQGVVHVAPHGHGLLHWVKQVRNPTAVSTCSRLLSHWSLDLNVTSQMNFPLHSYPMPEGTYLGSSWSGLLVHHN